MLLYLLMRLIILHVFGFEHVRSIAEFSWVGKIQHSVVSRGCWAIQYCFTKLKSAWQPLDDLHAGLTDVKNYIPYKHPKQQSDFRMALSGSCAMFESSSAPLLARPSLFTFLRC